MYNLNQKVAIITGARRGMGRTHALALASDDSSYMTGSTVVIDGGWLSA